MSKSFYLLVPYEESGTAKMIVEAETLEEDKIYFAGKAAITEFMDRIKQPISGDMVTFRIGIQKEEEEEDECC